MTPHENATVVETRLRVRYAETDQMGVVYHSNFIIWMEVGRVEMMRALGYTYRDMEQDGLSLDDKRQKVAENAVANMGGSVAMVSRQSRTSA